MSGLFKITLAQVVATKLFGNYFGRLTQNYKKERCLRWTEGAGESRSHLLLFLALHGVLLCGPE